MALFQPSFVTPDVRSGLGKGVVDATEDLVVSWRINGQSAMTAFSVTICLNDTASTQKYTTGQLTTGCPAYGTSASGETTTEPPVQSTAADSDAPQTEQSSDTGCNGIIGGAGIAALIVGLLLAMGAVFATGKKRD